MELDTVFETAKEKMTKTVDSLKYEYNTIRAGRASASVLDKIRVDYFGVPTPINQMAAISVPEARMLVIQPWDASQVHAIEKAILASDVGITPVDDGHLIRLAFPQLTEERRKQLTKDVSKYAEEAKVAVRNVRRDAMEKIKALKKASEITENDQKDAEEELQKITDDFIKKIEAVADEKSKEIMAI